MKSLNNILNIIIFIGVAGLGFFMYRYHQKSELTQSAQGTRRPSDAQDLANKYMQEVAKDLKAQQLKAQIAIKKSDHENPQQPRQITKEINPAEIPSDRQIWKDASVESEKGKTIENKFNEEIAESQQRKKRSELEKREFIRQYKENARKDGYEITINDDLEVIDVVPIRKPTNDVDGRAFQSPEF